MARTRIPTAWRQRLRAEFKDRCAYCHTPTAITGAQFVVDHIIPEAARGETIWENLCVACHSCNEFKGALSKAKDPRLSYHSLIEAQRSEVRSQK